MKTRSRTVTVKSYHGIGWDIRPGHGYARKKPDAIKIARMVADSVRANRILIYKDSGELQRTITIRRQVEP